MGTGCQVTLARAIPSPPIPDTGPPVLCAPPSLPGPQRGCVGVLGSVCVCVRMHRSLWATVCAHICVCLFRGVSLRHWSHGNSSILQIILCLDSILQGQGWHRLGSSWGSGLGCGEEL